MGHFLLFDPPDNPKNQSFEKTKKTPGYIIILHMCTTNDDHMMYGSWYMSATDRMFCPFGLFFDPLPPPTWFLRDCQVSPHVRFSPFRKILNISPLKGYCLNRWCFLNRLDSWETLLVILKCFDGNSIESMLKTFKNKNICWKIWH